MAQTPLINLHTNTFRTLLISEDLHACDLDGLWDMYFALRRMIELEPTDVILWQRLSRVGSYARYLDGRRNSMFIEPVKVNGELHAGI